MKPSLTNSSITTLSFFFLISIPISCSTRILQSYSSNNSFIKTSCGVTMYPQLCYNTLIAYASTIQTSPMEMANAALNISLKSAQSTSKMAIKLSKGRGLSPRGAGAIMDCVETIGDSVDELKQSLAAMNELDGPDFELKMSNIQTWVSAALTYEDTCMDGFEGIAKNMDGQVKGIIRNCIMEVAQFTSISLALINKMSSN